MGTVHPRAGGEHRDPMTGNGEKTGSSPRGRGTPPQPPRLHPPARFIPARAGNTKSKVGARMKLPVHPRAGGEHAFGARYATTPIGSSPRGRGTPRSPFRGWRGHRFIPARAGNTASVTHLNGASTVHPRAGGEHAIAELTTNRYGGSSPRGRGTPTRPCQPARRLRFIPARAGNTRPGSEAIGGASVHPRAGGEHADTTGLFWGAYGSSPRGRGTLEHQPQRRAFGRFIPARAGNTWPAS